MPRSADTGVDTLQKPDLSKAVEKLQPQEVIDADGAARQIFNFKSQRGKNVQAMFYTREELPFSKEAIEGKKAVVLGGAPKHRNIEEWKQFLIDVQENSQDHEYPHNAQNSKVNQAVEQENALFIVENTPVHLLDLAFHLGVEDKVLREIRQQIAVQKKYNPQALDLLDDLVAGTIIDDQGNVRKRQNQEGEAMTVLALLGDEQARGELDKRKGVIQKIDAKNSLRLKFFAEKQHQQLTNEGERTSASATATHVTKYKPEITPTGIEIKSSFDGSNETLTRNTVHLSLEGPIGSVFGGAAGDVSWENMPFMVSGDLSKMRDVNGNPIMVNSVDTYFALNPGQSLVFPDGHLTLPGLLANGTIKEDRGNVSYYKNKDFTPQDLDTFFASYYDNEMPYIQERYDESFKKYLQKTLWSDIRKSASDTDLATKWGELDTTLQGIDVKNVFHLLRTIPIPTAIETVFQNTSVSTEQKIRLGKKMEGWIAERNRNGSMYEQFNMGSGRSRMDDAMLGLSWGTKGSDRSQAHADDGDAGSGLQNVAGEVFQKVKQAEENKKRWEQQQAEAALHPEEHRLIAPWPESVYYDFRQDQRVEIGDRKNVMAAFREGRMDLTQRKTGEGDYKLWLPQHRRMFYLAGVI